MNNSSSRVPSLFTRLTRAALAVGALAATTATVFAGGNAGQVIYAPTLQAIDGILPYSRSATITITGSSTVTGPTVITFAPTVNSAPAGAINALSYLSFSPTQLTFSTPNQVLTVTATITLPANAVPGSYGYQVYTSGWTNTIDFGASLNSTASLAPVPNPPTALISTPFDGQVFTVAAANMPTTIPFQFTAVTTVNDPVVTSVEADLGGSSLAVPTVSGLNSANAAGAGTMTISAPGTYSLTAKGTNSVGTGSDVNSFSVVVTAPPPTVVINTPAPATTFTYRSGGAPVSVPYTFTATSNYGGIRTLTATLNGAPISFTPVGLNSLVATGTTSFSFSTAGTHTLSVTTTDDYGTATANSNFIVNVVSPTPTIAITSPANAASFNLASGATTMNIPFTFNTNTTATWTVDSVSASLDGNAIAITSTTPALGTAASVSSTGTMLNVGAGTHTLSATGISAGIQVSTSVTFTVVAVQALPPPTVVINTPVVGSTYSISAVGSPISIPLTFTGDSLSTSVAITGLTASLNGSALTVTPTNLGQKVATGAATMIVSAAGTYTISVNAIDSVGTANATRTFTVTVATPRTVSGKVYFDVDTDGLLDADEFGISAATVKLLNSSNALVATATTDSAGNYSISNIAPGSYFVTAVKPTGLKATTSNNVAITVGSSSVTVSPIGFGLDFAAINGMCANGFTIGYWKNNIDKALAGSCSGIQVSSTTLKAYTTTIASLATTQFDGMTMKSASSIMGSNSSVPTSLLAKQLMASEYNYCNGAYLGNSSANKNLTYYFIYWGEYVLGNPSKYTSNYTIWAKSWFDAYNNTHGGAIVSPGAAPTN
jgi:hypothetical protein